MDTNTIILILAGLVVVGLIYRSVSSKPEKTTGGGIAPTPTLPSQEELMKSTRAELVLMAEDLGFVVPTSYTKLKIVNMILIESRDRNSTN